MQLAIIQGKHSYIKGRYCSPFACRARELRSIVHTRHAVRRHLHCGLFVGMWIDNTTTLTQQGDTRFVRDAYDQGRLAIRLPYFKFVVVRVGLQTRRDIGVVPIVLVYCVLLYEVFTQLAIRAYAMRTSTYLTMNWSVVSRLFCSSVGQCGAASRPDNTFAPMIILTKATQSKYLTLRGCEYAFFLHLGGCGIN